LTRRDKGIVGALVAIFAVLAIVLDADARRNDVPTHAGRGLVDRDCPGRGSDPVGVSTCRRVGFPDLAHPGPIGFVGLILVTVVGRPVGHR
jgi:hypothetical protein